MFGIVLPASFCTEVVEIIDEMLGLQAVCARKLRSLAGKLSWAGGYIGCFASFLHSLWAALSDVFAKGAKHDEGGRPVVGVVRVAPALKWIRKFCLRQRGIVERWFPVELAPQCTVWVVCDASPFGYGGILVEEGRTVAYFSEMISQEDQNLWGIIVGDCKFQAKLELMAVLIAVRLWFSNWIGRKLLVGIKTDSMAALGSLRKLRSPTPMMSAIVREISLEAAEGLYEIDFLEHVAGDANAWADSLSRLHDPTAGAIVPKELAACPRHIPSKRGPEFWECTDFTEETLEMDNTETDKHN